MRRMANSYEFARVAAVIAVSLTWGATAHADPITYNFTGTVSGSRGMDIPAGTPFSGSFTYDPGLPTLDVFSVPSTATYYGSIDKTSAVPAGNLSAHADFGSLASFTPEGPATRILGVINGQRLDGSDPSKPGLDSFRISISQFDGGQLLLNLDDSTGKALDRTAIPTSLDLSKFDQPFLQYTKTDLVTGHSSAVYGSLTSLSSLQPVPVPEPSTLVVVGMGVCGFLIDRRRRIEARDARSS